jgi:FkbM family methyltransferase
MKLVDGIWLPDQEAHFPQWWSSPNNKEFIDGKATYQVRKLRETMGWVKKFRIAIDAGSHCGLWSMHLVKKFQTVHAFEPVPQFRQCFEKNVAARNVVLYACALGSVTGKVKMKIDPADTGGTHIDPTAESGDTVLRRLDEFDLADVDLIKIDAEGYEAHIVEGARDTIKRCHPCIIVEQKQHKLSQNFGIKGTPAVDILVGMGGKVRKIISGDYIVSWD